MFHTITALGKLLYKWYGSVNIPSPVFRWGKTTCNFQQLQVQ